MKEPKKEFKKDFKKSQLAMCIQLPIVMIALTVYHQIVAPKLIELSKKTE